MANSLQARVSAISPIVQNEYNGNVYQKVFVTLDCTSYNLRTGDEYPNFPRFEFNGDKGISEVSAIGIGDEVRISFELRGVNYVDKNTGEEKNFTSVRGYKIDVLQRSNHPPGEYQGQVPANNKPSEKQDIEDIPVAGEIDDLPF